MTPTDRARKLIEDKAIRRLGHIWVEAHDNGGSNAGKRAEYARLLGIELTHIMGDAEAYEVDLDALAAEQMSDDDIAEWAAEVDDYADDEWDAIEAAIAYEESYR